MKKLKRLFGGWKTHYIGFNCDPTLKRNFDIINKHILGLGSTQTFIMHMVNIVNEHMELIIKINTEINLNNDWTDDDIFQIINDYKRKRGLTT